MNARRPTLARGFTLIELLIVVAMVTILLVIATPSFVGFISNYRVTSATNDFLQAITVTRTEALRRGKRIVMLPNDSTGTPSVTGSWKYGWVVCEKLNAAATACAATTNVLFKHIPLDSSTTVADPAGGAAQPFTDATSKTYISFDGTGYGRTLASGTLIGGIRLADTMPSTGTPNYRTICLAILGPPRIIKGGTPVCS